MGAGVDPTQMCRRLVDKVGRWQQLFAVADPNLLVLFEDWLEELEEVVFLSKEQGDLSPTDLATRLGFCLKEARFF